MFELTMRRADTFTLVFENRVARSRKSGEFHFLGGSPGSWAAKAREHLAEFFAAGLIEDSPTFPGSPKPLPPMADSYPQRVTKAGDFLFRSWSRGPRTALVELPEAQRGAPEKVRAYEELMDWTVTHSWPLPDGGSVLLAMDKNEDSMRERVMQATANGIVTTMWTKGEAAAHAAAILAATR